MEELVADADADLLKLVTRGSSGLTEKDVRASLVRARIAVTIPVDTRPLPVVRQGTRSTADAAAGGTRATIRLAKSSAAVVTAGRKLYVGVTLADLIAAGIVVAPLELRRTYKGVEVKARIEADGSVTFNGQRLESPLAAGSMACARVRGVDPVSDPVATDGWSFWRFVDTNGTEKTIGALRERYLQRRGSPADHTPRSQSARRTRQGA